MRHALLFIALLSLTGCVAIAAGAGAVTGAAVASHREAAAQDDATCRSEGLEPESQPYLQCRSQLYAARNQTGAP
jgi:hypothetical protein